MSILWEHQNRGTRMIELTQVEFIRNEYSEEKAYYKNIGKISINPNFIVSIDDYNVDPENKVIDGNCTHIYLSDNRCVSVAESYSKIKHYLFSYENNNQTKEELR